MGGRAGVVAGCLALFLAGLALDFATPQRLVAAILLNVPIALSGLAFSRRLTGGLVAAALVANGAAAYQNAVADGGLDTVSLLNRGLLGASFVLVGLLTVALGEASRRLGRSLAEEARTRRERDAERVVAAAGPARTLEEALGPAAEALGAALGARGVVLTATSGNAFAAPRRSWPPGLTAWPEGAPLPRRLVGEGPRRPIPSDVPAEFDLSGSRVLVAGLPRRDRPPLLLAALEPAPEAEADLERLLPALAGALERAELLGDLALERAELERRNGVIRDLVYAFSHDLRTPLVAQGMSTRLALEGAYGPLPPEYRAHLEHGLAANEDLLRLADGLLLVARFESGEERPLAETVDLASVAREVAARLSPLAAERDVRLEVGASSPAAVLGSGADLRRVVQNLLDNAIRWSPPRGTVGVAVFSPPDRVRLEVRDAGPGVPPELTGRLFGRFAGRRAGGGSGLGLYLARRIAEAHGGRIGYSRYGRESLFWVELPALAAS